MKANKLLYKNLSAFLALGFGTGLSKKAPGTFGTLMAIPIFLISELLPGNINYLFVITLFFIGVYVSDQTSKLLKTKDPSCIVIDEIVAFVLLLMIINPTLLNYILAFILFRIFDIWKPFPINILEIKFKGGLGIMIDDIAAALFAFVIITMINYAY